jgi:hypothetical protein
MGLFLVLANLWLLQPVGLACGVNPDDLHAAPDSRITLFYLCLDERLDCQNVGKGRIKRSFRSKNWKPSIRADGTRAGDHHRLNRFGVAAKSEFNRVDYQLAVIETINHDVHDRALPDRYLSLVSVRFENLVQRWNYLFCKGSDTGLKTFRGLKHALSDGFKVLPASGGLAHYREVQSSRASNLADIRFSCSVLVSGSAVSCNHNLLISAYQSDRSSAQASLTAKNPDYVKDDQPKWTRVRHLGPTVICWRDKTDGPLTCSSDSLDIDGSQDGKKWFHVVGTWCPDGKGTHPL